jgi:hypothetical protein
MSVSTVEGVIHLHGNCGAEDVEPLVAAFDNAAAKTVDVSNADHLHGAVFQTLLAFAPVVLGSSRDSFVRTWLIPVLREARRASELDNGNLNQPPTSAPSEH